MASHCSTMQGRRKVWKSGPACDRPAMLLSAAAEIWVALEWPIRLLWCATTAGSAGLAVFISSTCSAGGRSKYMKVHITKKGHFRGRHLTFISFKIEGGFVPVLNPRFHRLWLGNALVRRPQSSSVPSEKRSTICAGLSNSLRFLFLRVGRTSGLNKCTHNVRIAISARSTDEKAIIGWQVTDLTSR